MEARLPSRLSDRILSMAIRKVPFVNNEYYHIFNRGVDKRELFKDYEDLKRFFQSMEEFNTVEPIGSIFENSFRKESPGLLGGPASKSLVNFICYCINPNHYHFILKQIINKGIEKFMQRLGTGYTKYFNHKYDRSGTLFQGKFKSVHVNSNEYLLHLSAYINLNDKVHKLENSAFKFVKSSWDEYTGKSQKSFCKKNIISGQFKNISSYKEFAENSLKSIKEKREIEKLLLE